jgi:hypothetical protein
MDEVVSRRIFASVDRVQSQVRSCGICGVHRGTGAGFLRVGRYPLSDLFPSIAPYSSVTTKVIQGVPGGKISILEGHSIGHSKQEIVCVHVYIYTDGAV